MAKRIFTLLLALVMVLGMLPTTHVHAEEMEEVISEEVVTAGETVEEPSEETTATEEVTDPTEETVEVTESVDKKTELEEEISIPISNTATKWNVINKSGVTGTQIVNKAQEFLGVPYGSNGGDYKTRTGFGSTMMFDCSGFVYRVCREVGLASSRQNYTMGQTDNNGKPLEGTDAHGNYYITAHTQEQRYYGTDISSSVQKYMNTGDYSELQPGDLLFTTDNNSDVSHVVFYAGNGKIIHCEGYEGCVAIHDISRYSYNNKSNWFFDGCRLVSPIPHIQEIFPSRCKLKANSATTAMSLPCNNDTDSKSTKVADVAKNATFTSTALILNDKNNYWYQVTVNGKTAYIPGSRLDFVSAITSDITISGTKAPSSLTTGQSFPVEGVIKATYNDISKVYADVYSGTTASGTAKLSASADVNGKSYSLKSSTIDNKLTFGSLSAGTYTYKISVDYVTYYTTDLKTKVAKTGRITLHTSNFTVSSSGSGTTTPTYYTVSFDAKGGSGAPANITVAEGSTITVPSNVPYLFGQTFITWWRLENDIQHQEKPGQTLTVTKNVAYNALYQPARDLELLDMVFFENKNSKDINGSIYFPNQEWWYTFSNYGFEDSVLRFESVGSADMQIDVYDADGNLITWDDDSGNGNNFLLYFNAVGIENYYIKVRMYGNSTGDFSFSVGVGNEINYDANGGSNAPATQFLPAQEYGYISSTIPTREGYTFLGWARSPDADVAYSPGERLTLTQNMTLYAQWASITQNCTITFDANGGSGAPSNITVDAGSTITLPPDTVPYRFGYTFRGWKFVLYGTEFIKKPGDSVIVYSDYEFVAIWDEAIFIEDNTVGFTVDFEFPNQVYWFKINPCWEYRQTMEFSTAGTADTYVYLFDSDGELLASDDDSGESWNCQLYYEFVGASDKTFYLAYGIIGSGTGNVDIEAYRGHFVTYDANGGSGAPDTYFCPYYLEYTISSTIPSRADYEFLGWSQWHDVTKAEFRPGERVMLTSHLNLYAIWQATGCSAGNHKYVSTNTIAPTCTEKGYTRYTCSVCGDSYTGNYTNAKGHTEVKVTGKAATCTETGKTDGKKCSVCGVTTVAQQSIKALGHTGGTATCKEKAVCTRCKVAYGELNSSNHTGGTTVKNKKAATCTEKGYSGDTYCKGCDAKLSSGKNISATDHNYIATVIKPTYTQGGYTEYTCEYCRDSYKDNFTERLVLTAPVITTHTNPVTGKPVVTWDAVEGATYKVYRSTYAKGTYKCVGTVEGGSFEYSSASIGKMYFKVKVVVDGETSKYSAYKSATCKCAQPQVESYITYSTGKVNLSWKKVSGAKKYYIYRATSEGGKYTNLGYTTKLKYTDSSAKVGTRYYYKIKAVPSSSSYSTYSAVVNNMRICAEVNVKVTIGSNGKPSLSWSKISGAKYYKIARFCDNQKVELGTTTSTTFKDLTAEVGQEYSYYVTVIGKVAGTNNGTKGSKETSPVCVTCAKPSVSIKLSSKKPKLSWKPVEGATKYYVYRATSKSGKYTKVATVTGTSYTDKKAKKGKTYYYKVKAIAANSKANSVYSSVDKIKSK